MIMKARNLISILILSLIVLGPAVAWAQNGGSGVDRLRDELERTDEIIVLATQAVMAANNAVAERSLRAAEALQEQAWTAFNNEQYLIAGRLTSRARESAKAAISSSRNSEQIEGVVLSRLERAREQLDRAAEAVELHQNTALRSLLESARDNLARAWEFYRDRQYKPALKLADQVEKAAIQLMKLAKTQDRNALQFLRNRDQAEAFIQQTQDRIAGCNSELARSLLDQAVQALELADNLADQERYHGAIQALKRVRDLTWQAIRECQGSDQLTGRYERLLGEADRLADDLSQLRGTEADAARKLLDQAYEQLDLARSYIQNNNTDAAVASLQAAQLALRQAQRYITPGQ